MGNKIWLEGGGGGPADEGCYACEAYDIAAFYFAHRCRMVNANKPILFFCADEGPRRTVNKAWVKRILDIDIEANIPTKQIFAALRKKLSQGGLK
ncbi:hypothetical protein Pelo_19780 [Pelomyxa schiedti]|nr:hypothetical protein Pelo_19780 [Pelomyxa schiedti]